jgi:molybdopterin/thiamine biosynthesis adenylyltransferase
MSTKTRFDRFSEAIWFSQDSKQVIVGGCGGIGSWLSLFLSRAGFYPIIYDYDSVEEHNIGGQCFKTTHNGSLKVDAIADVIKDFTGDDAFTIMNEKIDKESMVNNYVFSAFDNMKARKDLFENWLESYKGQDNAIFIDGRLLAESYQIFCVRANDEASINAYQSEHLFDDSQVEDAPCSLKQTTHMAAMIAANMLGMFTNYITNVKEEGQVREVPFYHSYFLPINMTDL